MSCNVEVELVPTVGGLLIRKKSAAEHPVDRVYGILGRGRNTDDYLEAIRGR